MDALFAFSISPIASSLLVVVIVVAALFVFGWKELR